jgi:long-chain acyl-CoA synthetase
MTRGTLTQLFFGAVERHGGRPAAFRSKTQGRWQPITHREAAERVQNISLGLRALGVKPGDRVALLSENRPEWAFADYACLCARATDVPIYTTLPAKQAEYILRDSGTVAVFVSNDEQLAKVQEVRGNLPALKQLITFDDVSSPSRGGAFTLAQVEEMGRKAANQTASWRAEAQQVQPDDLATIIYTSGTTGDPKGVMLTHNNIYANVVAALQVMPIAVGDEALSMLPLSHIFERMVAYTLFHGGVVINYAESIEALRDNLLEVKPTIMLSVPRVYEKVYARVLENALSGSGLKRRIFFWAKDVGDEWATHTLAGLPIPTVLGVKHRLADKLVFSKVRARTGGRIKFFVSGGAPLSAEIAKFFFSAGLPIAEGYGLTETSPVLTLNPLERIKLGTVGKAIPGVQIKIAPDGEILGKGPSIMKGYFNKPDATKDAIDADGWFHTGDIGELDGDGYLKITDRKKDLIVTAGGKNIAPQPIENMVKLNKFVANAVMLGDRRKFTIMLVVPNFDTLETWAKERNLLWRTHTDLLDVADVKAKMEREVMGMMRDLAKYEMPKRVVLLDADFTIENGQLTPTLKVKRRAVEKAYKDLIDKTYSESDAMAGIIEG